ncbi:MAG: hypothetical protein Q9166_005299 [cf. Caloplaca sp. 2 TL-2023]
MSRASSATAPPPMTLNEQHYIMATYSNFDITYEELTVSTNTWWDKHFSVSEVEAAHKTICREIDAGGKFSKFVMLYDHQHYARDPDIARGFADLLEGYKFRLIKSTQRALSQDHFNCTTGKKALLREQERCERQEHDEFLRGEIRFVDAELNQLQAKIAKVDSGDWPRERHWPEMWQA